MAEIIEVVEAAFVEKGHGRVEMPPKPGIHPRPDAFIHAMPAAIDGLGAAGLKWVSGYPQNQAKGLPYIGGIFVLNDPETGLVRMISDCTWITAQRTAAATAVGVKHLARRGAKTVALLGLGVQGHSHHEALSLVIEDAAFVGYDIDDERAVRFAKDTGATIVDGPEAAVRDADIVVTAGPILKDPTPAIDESWIAPGATVCPVDFDSYVKPNVLLETDHFYTDDLDQLGYYRTQGYFDVLPERRVELADVVVGKDGGRQNDEERIVVMNLGIALEDVAVGSLLYERAKARGIGTTLEP